MDHEPTPNDERRPLFNEASLRADIVATWGEHGAHADVFDMLLMAYARQRRALQDIVNMDDHEVRTAARGAAGTALFGR